MSDTIGDTATGKTTAAWTCSCGTANAGGEDRCTLCGDPSPRYAATRAAVATPRAGQTAGDGAPIEESFGSAQSTDAAATDSRVDFTRSGRRAPQRLLRYAIAGILPTLIGATWSGETTFSPHFDVMRNLGWGAMWCGAAVLVGVILAVLGEVAIGPPRTRLALIACRWAAFGGFAAGALLMILLRTHYVVSGPGYFTPPVLAACAYVLALSTVGRRAVGARFLTIPLALVCALAVVGGTVSQHGDAGSLTSNVVVRDYLRTLDRIQPPYTRRPIVGPSLPVHINPRP